ncbi:BZ3500_MvSof-1268-A1-R1_Chr7-1g09458 [Microbotryum saponariae]|uniref:BZ3500_MvSof-1268-A1-R1_Chr7-1g09458 protein n=1 Tax=Microbotryum saponariae TaxID=289078 RepID=A0A2X0LJU4_9BASI|nr:BZ3501_MvSof-1269-A2-R1_Chr7-1g09163 [Microbotryum saponariae]SDA03488.1 BZ3500_MvSof-1268-A1-R1_Chr7-1g09458 [Microbotryum saponariae]
MAVEAHLSNKSRNSLWCDKSRALNGTRRPGTDQLSRLPVPLDDNVRAHAVLDKGLALPQQLSRKQDDAGRAIADFRILRSRDIDQGLGGGVNDLEEFEYGRSVVGDGGLAVVADDELVHATGTERRGDGLRDREAGADVGQELRGSCWVFIRALVAGYRKVWLTGVSAHASRRLAVAGEQD